LNYTIINVGNKNITATPQKEIFKFSSSSNIKELIDFNPADDKIYLPKSAKEENLEIILASFYSSIDIDWSSPYDGSTINGVELSSYTNIMLSSTKHPYAKDNPASQPFFSEAKKNTSKLLKYLLHKNTLEKFSPLLEPVKNPQLVELTPSKS
jgi:hypothetical protein